MAKDCVPKKTFQQCRQAIIKKMMENKKKRLARASAPRRGLSQPMNKSSGEDGKPPASFLPRYYYLILGVSWHWLGQRKCRGRVDQRIVSYMCFLSRSRIFTQHPKGSPGEQQRTGCGLAGWKGKSEAGQCCDPAAETGGTDPVPTPTTVEEEAQGSGGCDSGCFRGWSAELTQACLEGFTYHFIKCVCKAWCFSLLPPLDD